MGTVYEFQDILPGEVVNPEDTVKLTKVWDGGWEYQTHDGFLITMQGEGVLDVKPGTKWRVVALPE